MTNLTITPGCTVLIAGFDDIPSHQFLVQEVFEDCITGTALTGHELVEYEKYNSLDEKIYNFSTEGHE